MDFAVGILVIMNGVSRLCPLSYLAGTTLGRRSEAWIAGSPAVGAAERLSSAQRFPRRVVRFQIVKRRQMYMDTFIFPMAPLFSSTRALPESR